MSFSVLVKLDNISTGLLLPYVSNTNIESCAIILLPWNFEHCHITLTKYHQECISLNKKVSGIEITSTCASSKTYLEAKPMEINCEINIYKSYEYSILRYIKFS